MKNLSNSQKTAVLAKMSRQWKWLQQQRNNGTVIGAIITKP